ncbi:MAG: hypothetical protein Q7K29_00260 [Thermoleophilia bacterium]|nr:hypothetical protein [Thermoleophilia bacterium]
MSGKATGKKHNRAAQSLQHGFQVSPENTAVKTRKRSTKAVVHDDRTDRQRILDQLRELDEKRRERE